MQSPSKRGSPRDGLGSFESSVGSASSTEEPTSSCSYSPSLLDSSDDSTFVLRATRPQIALLCAPDTPPWLITSPKWWNTERKDRKRCPSGAQ
eukprot:7386035-Prymnesium_polylepis.3